MNYPTKKYLDDSPSDIIRKVGNMSLEEARREVSSFGELDIDDFEFEPDLRCPSERIVFVVDTTEQRLMNDLKNAINIFVTTKHAINADHEYALIMMKPHTCSRPQEFTGAPKQMINLINRMTVGSSSHSEFFVLDNVFEALHELRLKQTYKHYIFRVIFFYTRCFSELAIHRQCLFDELAHDPRVIFDGILVTQKPTHDEQLVRMSQVYKSFAKMIIKGRDLIVQNNTELNESTMMLLAHPNQREKVPKYDYAINPIFTSKKRDATEQEHEHTYM